MRFPAAILLLTPGLIHAQWLHQPTPGIPRNAKGDANLSAPAPKLADGRGDLTGIWMGDGVKYTVNIAADLKPEDVPYQPWALEVYKQRQANLGKDDPVGHCNLPGVPQMDAIPYPQKIVNAQGMVLILYEAFATFRQIFTDGRPLPKDPNPTWMGYSVGRWDGETLVVETTGFNDKSWIDTGGRPHSEALHVTERYRRRDFGHLEVQITIDDPKAYTKPWTVTEVLHLLPDTELLEYVCNENNKDLRHLVGK